MAGNPDAIHGIDLRRATENQIQKVFVRHINANPHGKAISIYNGAIAIPCGKVAHRWGMFYCRFKTKEFDRPDGTPDILGAWNGHPFFIEVKKPKQKSTPEQIFEQEQWRKQGYRVAVCTTFSELLAFLNTMTPLE